MQQLNSWIIPLPLSHSSGPMCASRRIQERRRDISDTRKLVPASVLNDTNCTTKAMRCEMQSEHSALHASVVNRNPPPSSVQDDCASWAPGKRLTGTITCPRWQPPSVNMFQQFTTQNSAPRGNQYNENWCRFMSAEVMPPTKICLPLQMKPKFNSAQKPSLHYNIRVDFLKAF